ncbi:MAG: hypothetical protein ABSD72_18535 [Terracidiphilus sp.]|jgi:hypothetical protein
MLENDGQEFFIELQSLSTCSWFDARGGKRDSSRKRLVPEKHFCRFIAILRGMSIHDCIYKLWKPEIGLRAASR